jgi:carboxymethylenebutenolidase
MPGENVEFSSNGGTARGYLSVPEGCRGPGVVVIQEWWGLVPHIESVADRLAGEGYVALAPDLYHGEKTKSPDEPAS